MPPLERTRSVYLTRTLSCFLLSSLSLYLALFCLSPRSRGKRDMLLGDIKALG